MKTDGRFGRVFSLSSDTLAVNTSVGPRLFRPATGQIIHLGLRWYWTSYPALGGGMFSRTVGGGFSRLTPDLREIFFLNAKIPGGWPDHVVEDPRGGMWIADHTELYRFKDGVLETFPDVVQLLDSFIGEMLVAQDGALWMQTDQSGVLVLREQKSLEYTWNTVDPDNDQQIDTRAKVVRHDGEKSLFVGRLGLNQFGGHQYFEEWNLESNERYSINLTNWFKPDAFDLSRDKSDVLWLGVSKHPEHFAKMNTNQPQPILVRHQHGLERYYRQDVFPWDIGYVHSVAWRAPGDVWLGTDRGVFQLRDEELHHWNGENSLPQFDALCVSSGPGSGARGSLI